MKLWRRLLNCCPVLVGLLGAFLIVQCSGQMCDETLTVKSFSENPIEDDVRTCIECVIGGSVSTTATWLIGTTPGAAATTPIRSSDGEVVNGVLVIFDPSTIIPGLGSVNNIRVSCSAGGTSLNFFISLDKFLPPVVNDVTVNETDTLVLSCVDSNSGISASIQWQNSEGEVVEKSHTFTVENVSRNYTGVYTCILTRNDNNETLSANASVTVQYGPEVTTQEDDMQSVLLANNLSLSCDFDGVPTPIIEWFHNGSLLSDSDPNVSITTDDNSSLLELTNLQRDSGGQYFCNGTNVVGTGSSMVINLIVSDPVSVNATTLAYTTHVTATTTRTTETPDVISRSSNMATTTIGAVVGVLILLVLAVAVTVIVLFGVLYYRKRHKDMGLSNANLGVYSRTEVSSWGESGEPSDLWHKPDNCNMSETPPKMEITANQSSTIIENGASCQGPVISEFPQETTIVEGQDVSFKVVVTGYPSPTLQWYHNKDELVQDYSIELGQDGSLNIPCSEKRHGGVYKLVAANSMGSVEKVVELKVLDENHMVSLKGIDFSPKPLADFGSFVASNHKNSNTGFRDLYQALEKGDSHTTRIGLSPENKKLNRFARMTVYDDNRIVLEPTDTFEASRFINACYIDGYHAPKKFIATQGPLKHTLTDFWRLVLQEKVNTIVMVTNLKEGNKKKCEQYWPDSGSVEYGPLVVTITDQQILADYTIRSFELHVADSSEQPMKVMQYHYTTWPDHGVPTYTTSVLAFHKKVLSQHKPEKGPILVHCSAGVGRTGTFITIDSVQEQVKNENIVDIAGIVNRMRHQRMRMVQTQDQFMFIHDAILETVMCGDTQINADDLETALTKLEATDEQTDKTALQEQFEVLEQVTSSANERFQCAAALRNPDKNRRSDHLPSENHRIALHGEFPDYINATSVDGYKRKRCYIIAEGPMDCTVRNFWKMISDRKCGVIVMCSDLVENEEESSCQYWPGSSEMPERYGEFSVALLDEEEYAGYTIRNLSLEVNEKPPQNVTHFHITNWNVDGSCSDLKSITDVIENVTLAQRRTGNHPIVVHCHDTVGRSGMFCAIMTTIERCKTEGVVDVFQVIKALRVQKPGAILNVEQYHLVIKSVLAYLDSLDTYANFQTV